MLGKVPGGHVSEIFGWSLISVGFPGKWICLDESGFHVANLADSYQTFQVFCPGLYSMVVWSGHFIILANDEKGFASWHWAVSGFDDRMGERRSR